MTYATTDSSPSVKNKRNINMKIRKFIKSITKKQNKSLHIMLSNCISVPNKEGPVSLFS